jgi:hypothetical protein
MVMMSLVQFDEMYEICCGMMAEEEKLITSINPTIERLDLMNDCIPDSDRWWKVAIRELANEKESELFYV